MTSSTANPGWRLPWSEEGAAETRAVEGPPPRKRLHGPVFIGDAVTPWAGETLLLSRLRAQALAQMAEDEPEG